MRGGVFVSLLFPTLAGACLAAVILLLRPFTKKVFGYAWHYYIWLAVLITMLLPVRFSLPQVANTIPTVLPATQTEQTAQTGQAQNTAAAAPAPLANPGTNLLQAGTGFIKSVVDNRMNMIAYVWLAGAVILLLIHLAGYIRLMMEMRKTSVPVSCPELAGFTKRKVKVRMWENTSSPFLVGIIKPTLVLPAREFTEEQFNNILRHEMTHLKRHDILYKWIAVFVKCLHWFNPMIWVVAKQINIECEISCDMAVTRDLSKNEEMRYIETLLSLLPMGKAKQIPLTTQMAGSKKMLKRRFLMMKTKKATSKLASVLSAVVALAMLSTTVFASGVLSGLAGEDYTVEITNNGEVIELVNKPFIENGEVYVPLREMFEKVGVINDEESYINWDNGKIEALIIPSNEDKALYSFEIGLQKDSEKMTTPYGTVELLFKAFHKLDFEKMKGYCTENCVDKFFEDSCVFGMKNASIKSMSYANGSLETSDRAFIEVSLYKIEFDGNSVFSEGRNPTSFYLILQRQDDGRYLIDEFATGL